MDRDRFDALARLLATSGSRRVTLGTLLGALVGPTAAEAARKGRQDRGKTRQANRTGRDRGPRARAALAGRAPRQGGKRRKTQEEAGRPGQRRRPAQPPPPRLLRDRRRAPTPNRAAPARTATTPAALRRPRPQRLHLPRHRRARTQLQRTDNQRLGLRRGVPAGGPLPPRQARRQHLGRRLPVRRRLHRRRFGRRPRPSSTRRSSATPSCPTAAATTATAARRAPAAGPARARTRVPVRRRLRDCGLLAAACAGGQCGYTQSSAAQPERPLLLLLRRDLLPIAGQPVHPNSGSAAPPTAPAARAARTAAAATGRVAPARAANAATRPAGASATSRAAPAVAATPTLFASRATRTRRAAPPARHASSARREQGCLNRQCVACTPNCTGKVCGPDGCGRSCGTCPTGLSCDDGSGRCLCTTASCPNGCCSAGPDNPGACLPGDTDQSCNKGGLRCVACASGSTCGGRGCQPVDCRNLCGSNFCLNLVEGNVACQVPLATVCNDTEPDLTVCTSTAECAARDDVFVLCVASYTDPTTNQTEVLFCGGQPAALCARSDR